jgi:hypothetical protein
MCTRQSERGRLSLLSEGLLSCLEEPAASAYSEPDESSPPSLINLQAVGSSQTMVILYRTAWHHNPQDSSE